MQDMHVAKVDLIVPHRDVPHGAFVFMCSVFLSSIFEHGKSW